MDILCPSQHKSPPVSSGGGSLALGRDDRQLLVPRWWIDFPPCSQRVRHVRAARPWSKKRQSPAGSKHAARWRTEPDYSISLKDNKQRLFLQQSRRNASNRKKQPNLNSKETCRPVASENKSFYSSRPFFSVSLRSLPLLLSAGGDWSDGSHLDNFFLGGILCCVPKSSAERIIKSLSNIF